MAEIIPARDPHAVDLAVSVLHGGELVAFPTDTVYGLGAVASNRDAVRALFVAKGRPPSKPLPLFVADSAMAAWVADVTPVCHNLMEAFWPGALTIVMRKLPGYDSPALAGSPTVALRVPDHDVPRSIVRVLREPITGTSANRSGMRPPVSAAEVAFQMGELVALVIDGGRSRSTTESTIIDTTAEGGPKVLRAGAVRNEDLERVLGKPLT